MRLITVSALTVALALLGGPVVSAFAAESGNTAAFDRLCSDEQATARHAKFVEWIQERLLLNDAQTAAFKDFQDTRAKSLADSKAKICANKPDFSSFETRVVFGQTLMETRLDALKAENPKLIAFYNSLDDKQKAKFEEIRRHAHR
jgi:hypothetical protein